MLTGSIINICIYQIPKKQRIVFNNSSYNDYNNQFKWYGLLSTFSILYYKANGKQSYSKIFIRNLIVELSTGILFILLYYKFKLCMDFIVYMLIFSFLIVVGFIDIDHQIIPDILVKLTFLVALSYEILKALVYGYPIYLTNKIIALAIGALSFIIINIVSNGGIGGGDIKLIAALGFILGISKLILTIFISFILGAAVSIVLLMLGLKRRKDVIPFAPFIIFSFLIVFFWGQKIIDWYLFNLSR